MAEASGGSVDPWYVVIAAIATGIVGLLTAFFSGVKGVVTAWLRRLERRAGANDYHRGVKGIIQWYEIIESLKELEYVDRVLIFSGTNSGGVPLPGKPYYVACTGGWATNGKHPERLYVGPMMVDLHYMKMIGEIIERGVSVQTVADMPVESMLRNLYAGEGVVQSLLFCLSLDSSELIYCSVASYHAKFDVGQVATINVIVSRIRGLLGTLNTYTPKP
jgi:hypothetical protein